MIRIVKKMPPWRQLQRHAVKFVVRCDLVDQTGRGWPATLTSEPGFYIGLLLVTPRCDGGRKLCAALNKGDVLEYRLQRNTFAARVATKDGAAGPIWLHAVDVSGHAFVPISIPDEADPRWRPTVQKHARYMRKRGARRGRSKHGRRLGRSKRGGRRGRL